MKKSMIILAFAVLYAAYAYSDSNSIYVLGTYLSPDGRSDIFDINRAETTFDTDDLNFYGITAGYDRFLGEFVSVGGSFTFYKHDATGRDRAFLTPNGQPVRRDFRLRIIPMEFNVSVLPVGRQKVVILFIGAGVGFYRWKYVEEGNFVIDRDSNPTVVRDRASSSGTDFGYNYHGGIHIPVSNSAALTVLVKHIHVEGDLDDARFRRFEPIDLSSYAYSAGVSFWF